MYALAAHGFVGAGIGNNGAVLHGIGVLVIYGTKGTRVTIDVNELINMKHEHRNNYTQGGLDLPFVLYYRDRAVGMNAKAVWEVDFWKVESAVFWANIVEKQLE